MGKHDDGKDKPGGPNSDGQVKPGTKVPKPPDPGKHGKK